jgi:RNA-directed DNA polymerase
VVGGQRSVRNLGDPHHSCLNGQVGHPGERRDADDEERVRSAHSTLRREDRAHGEGADRNTEPAQATWTGQGGPGNTGTLSTFVQGIATKAQEQPKHRFGNRYEWLNESFLNECWRDIRKEAASGVDRISAQDDERHLDENIHHLVERLKRKPYRAKLVRRQYIPKGDGKLRPLGIPAVEEKLLQLAVARILQAIYEQDFLRGSDGDRPHVGALDAVDRLTIKLPCGRDNCVVEADIKGFVDNIEHGWLVRMLEERMEDGAFWRLIKKWLKAGGLDTAGQVLHPATGTPQGGSRTLPTRLQKMS